MYIMNTKPTSVFHHFTQQRSFLGVRLKPEYCKYDELDESSNVFWDVKDSLDNEEDLQ